MNHVGLENLHQISKTVVISEFPVATAGQLPTTCTAVAGRHQYVPEILLKPSLADLRDQNVVGFPKLLENDQLPMVVWGLGGS